LFFAEIEKYYSFRFGLSRDKEGRERERERERGAKICRICFVIVREKYET